MAKIRLWKLGSLEYKIIPTNAAREKLSDLLKQDGETIDIIWGPDIEVQELDDDNIKDVVLAEDMCKQYLESTGKYIVSDRILVMEQI